MMTVLVAGATGNTGRPLVEQSLALGHTVRVIVRSRSDFQQRFWSIQISRSSKPVFSTYPMSRWAIV